MKIVLHPYPTLPLITLLVASIFMFIAPTNTSAASLANWNAGNIIEDAVFTNSGTMNTAEIQSLLESKVPVCDTYGTQPSEFGGGTRAEWAAARGYSPPFTCLKDFKENGKTSAQIIYEASQEFSINPQVLIVLLQKEQSLVTDTWPIPGSAQYRTATGYGCPDTTECASEYFGLTNQVNWAARMFRAVINDSPTWYTPYIVGSNFIRYSPDVNCGGSTVIIENRATQALYNYTPYQPNQATLSAGWGMAYCGAYGNRNFYHYFVDWFGSTRAVNGSVVLASNLTIDEPSSALIQNDTVTASFTIRNKSNSPINAGGFGICGRLNGSWYDFGFIHQNYLAANAEKTISFSKKLTSTGQFELFICSYNDALGGWAGNSYPYNDVGTIRRINTTVSSNPALITSVEVDQDNLYVGSEVVATFTIRNASSQPISLGRIVLAVRDSKQNNYDFPSDTDIIIPAGGTYMFNKTKTFENSGKYTYFLSNLSTNGVWSSQYPTSVNTSIARTGSFNIKPNPNISSNITFSPSSPQVGDTVTASVTIINNSSQEAFAGRPVVSLRSENNDNYDFPSSEVTIPAGKSITYTQSRVFDKPGRYSYELTNNFSGTWLRDYPTKQTSSITTNGKLHVADSVSITLFSLSSSNHTGSAKQLNATVIVRNTTSEPVNIGRLVVAVRNQSNQNLDLPSSTETIVPPNSSITITTSRELALGQYSLQIATKTASGWSYASPDIISGMLRSRTIKL